MEEELPKKTFWFSKYVESKNADKWLSFFTFIESSFFPLPPSTLMIAIMSSRDRHKEWFYYGSLTTLMSVLGGVFGYIVGFLFYDTLGQIIIDTYDLAEQVTKVGQMFQDNAFLAIFIAAFTPIPYKVFTISAGFFRIDLFIFITASILGRGIRFYVVAFFVNFLGRRSNERAMRYLNHTALLIAAGIILYFLYKVVVSILF